ncbi:MAG: RidA family protein [Alphaproteobacteria bacterium]|nr:RidA family protein [Pseudomonadota bacterium]
MSERRRIFSGSTFEKIAGYARAVVDGDWVHVSGCTGMDYASGEISDDAAEQTHQVFRNINWALAQAGTSLDDVVRIRVYLDSRDDFAVVGPVLGDYLRHISPANTTVVAPLVDARMKVEIEVTAHKAPTT